MTEQASHNNEDAAWASFQTLLDSNTLYNFCLDVERLFRINPYLEFTHWEKLGTNRFRFAGHNSSQQPAFDFDYIFTVNKGEDEIVINYENALKTSSRFKIEPAAAGAKLTITEDYSGSPREQREARLHEVDQSLVAWANDLQRYLYSWQRWSWLRPWRWYMRRIWQPLKPTGRRIVYMFIWISIVEVALIALGGAIYWLEYR